MVIVIMNYVFRITNYELRIYYCYCYCYNYNDHYDDYDDD